MVQGVPRLADDLHALAQLFSTPRPPRRVIRSTSVIVALYGFGDASGEGFGSTLLTPHGLCYRYGLWGRDLSHQSSNFRELHNLVDIVDVEITDAFPTLTNLVSTVEDLIQEEEAPGAELFLFTDNSVAEGAFYRGTSSNPRLFDLILRLRCLEMHHSLRLHIIHVSGQRMIRQGTDGLSRGDLDMGVMSGTAMLDFVPLHLGALDRAPLLLEWLHSWCPGYSIRPISPQEWPTIGHGITNFYVNQDGFYLPESHVGDGLILLWTPLPTAAEYALEELGLSRHKRPHIRHLFVCPRLYTHTWRKRLYKLADYVHYLPPGRRPGAWPLQCYEPLIIGVFLPFLPTHPWTQRLSAPLTHLDGLLRDCWRNSCGNDTPLLSQLWSLPH
jgi:hypothetical protein